MFPNRVFLLIPIDGGYNPHLTRMCCPRQSASLQLLRTLAYAVKLLDGSALGGKEASDKCQVLQCGWWPRQRQQGGTTSFKIYMYKCHKVLHGSTELHCHTNVYVNLYTFGSSSLFCSHSNSPQVKLCPLQYIHYPWNSYITQASYATI